MRFPFSFIMLCLATNLCAWNPAPFAKKVIVLDSRFAFKETLADDDYAFDILQKVQDQLLVKGYAVFLTTERDKALSMQERENFTREKEADLYFSLSFYTINKTKYGRKKSGVAENYLITPIKGTSGSGLTSDGRPVSNMLKEELSSRTDAYTRVVNYTIVNKIPCPGVHMNIEYKDNTELHKKIQSTAYQIQLAESIVKTIGKAFSN